MAGLTSNISLQDLLTNNPILSQLTVHNQEFTNGTQNNANTSNSGTSNSGNNSGSNSGNNSGNNSGSNSGNNSGSNSGNNDSPDLNLPTNDSLVWDSALENIFTELADEAQINTFLHKKAHHYFKIKNMKFQLPVIVFSALSGSGNFMSTYFPDYTDQIVLAIGFVSIIISIVSSLAQYLKLSEMAEGNRLSYLSWEKFFINIKFQLRRKREKRDNIKEFLNQIIPEYQRLKEISPEIPNMIVAQLKKKKGYNRMKIPTAFNGFHPFTPYVTQKDIDAEENVELGILSKTLSNYRNGINSNSFSNNISL
jgi:hypothetical protein